MHYCERIGRDMGYGSCGETVVLWVGLGGRLGVDLLGRSVVARWSLVGRSVIFRRFFSWKKK